MDESWESLPLPGVGTLLRSRALPIATARAPRGALRVLLGSVVSTSGRSPRAALEECDAADLRRESRSWAGRFVLVDGASLSGDAGGLLGVYTRVADGEIRVSSSAALLLLGGGGGGGEPSVASRDLAHRDSINWYPLPGSRYRGIGRLYPGESIDLSTGARSFEAALEPEPGSPSAIDDLIDHLLAVIRGIAAAAPRVWLPLTAGYDSRLLLAACRGAGIPVVTITQKKPQMAAPDAVIPPELARIAGLEHRFVEVGPEIPGRLELYDLHTARQVHDIDRSYFARDQLGWAGPEDVILRGGGFEVGRCYYWKRLPESELPPEGIAAALGSECDAAMLASLSQWRDHCRRHPMPSVDWRDRFYLEQRVGGWLSAVEQSLDLLPGIRFHAANSARFYSTVLSVPAEQRRMSLHHVEIIRRLSPELLRLPFNSLPGGEPILPRILRRIRRLLRAGEGVPQASRTRESKSLERARDREQS